MTSRQEKILDEFDDKLMDENEKWLSYNEKTTPADEEIIGDG